LNRYLLVALGGALGSVLRYFVTATVVERLEIRFPYGTVAVNISVCFALGLVMEYFNRHLGIGDAWRFLLAVGFIGGYSTFSTFEWETWSSLNSGAFWIGMVYVVISVAGRLVAVAAGTSAARALP
jgi:CrcB protein